MISRRFAFLVLAQGFNRQPVQGSRTVSFDYGIPMMVRIAPQSPGGQSGFADRKHARCVNTTRLETVPPQRRTENLPFEPQPRCRSGIAPSGTRQPARKPAVWDSTRPITLGQRISTERKVDIGGNRSAFACSTFWIHLRGMRPLRFFATGCVPWRRVLVLSLRGVRIPPDGHIAKLDAVQGASRGRPANVYAASLCVRRVVPARKVDCIVQGPM